MSIKRLVQLKYLVNIVAVNSSTTQATGVDTWPTVPTVQDCMCKHILLKFHHKYLPQFSHI